MLVVAGLSMLDICRFGCNVLDTCNVSLYNEKDFVLKLHKDVADASDSTITGLLLLLFGWIKIGNV